MQDICYIIFGFTFIFLMTALGAGLVFCFRKEIPASIQAKILGFSSGVMLAASIWSLILPALSEAAHQWGQFAFIPATTGLLLGALFIFLLEKVTQSQFFVKGNIHKDVVWTRAKKLFYSVTIHNIPEGLAVGFAFGAAFSVHTQAAYITALGLALGMGLQNFPEGAAVALPIRVASKSRIKGVAYGIVSGIVEPIFAVIGFFFAAYLRVLQPWLLTFSAGTMLFVIIEELLPAAKYSENQSGGTWWAIIGFVLMMILDVALS